MSKLYALIEGLVCVATPPGQEARVLLIQTYPGDKDAMGRPFPLHLPRISFRSKGMPMVRKLSGQDVEFLTGAAKPATPPVRQLDRLPSFASILSFAPSTNGNTAAQLAAVKPGCVGNAPGSACLIPKGKQPRLAGRILIDQGTLTSVQVDDSGNPVVAPPARFKFLFIDNASGPALDMQCDNALLLKIDAGAHPVQVKVGNKTFTLDKASQIEKDAVKLILDDPAADCVIVRISDMVDPMMIKHMVMQDSADAHFPIFFDLLGNYKGSRVIPTLIGTTPNTPGDIPLSRCIPPTLP
jgi:hypothetical protein